MALLPVSNTLGPRVNGQPLPGVPQVTTAEGKESLEDLEAGSGGSHPEGHTALPLQLQGLELVT